MIHPDDQVLDYCLYQKRIGLYMEDVERWKTGYQFWVSQGRKP